MARLSLQCTLLYSTLTLLSILVPTASGTTSHRLSNDPPVPGSLDEQDCVPQRYRNTDGSCNNIKNPLWGTPGRLYKSMVKCPYKNEKRPNARFISTALFPDVRVDDPVWTHFAGLWGQVIAHDLSFVSGTTQSYDHPIQCCTADGQLTQEAQSNPRCKPIIAPKGDPDLPEGHCMNFVKGIKAADKGYTGPDAGQFTSAVTAYMDLSIVYGNSDEQLKMLRSYKDGKLKEQRINENVWPPTEPNSGLVCNCLNGTTVTCFLTGDLRGNQHPWLTIFQTILLRLHNFIAEILTKLNPQWSDEMIFQETRRLCIALYWYINYYEWLPIFLGNDYMVKHKLIYPSANNFIYDYDRGEDSTVSGEFASASNRNQHSLIQGLIELLDEWGNPKSQLLSNHFNCPKLAVDNMEDLIRGATIQLQSANDQYWTSEVNKFLFKKPNELFGLDLRALDIERGRDHYLCDYPKTCAAFGIKPPNTYAELSERMGPAKAAALIVTYDTAIQIEEGKAAALIATYDIALQLKKGKAADLIATYNKIKLSKKSIIPRIDMVVASAMEKKAEGSLLGYLDQAITADQFLRTRKGDYFSPENGHDHKTRFTLPQLNEIRKIKCAHLLCWTTNLKETQSQPFMKPGPGNPTVPCSKLHQFNWSLWKSVENSEDGYPLFE